MKPFDPWLCIGIAAGILLTALPECAQASGRYVLNQTPQAIERYFGLAGAFEQKVTVSMCQET